MTATTSCGIAQKGMRESVSLLVEEKFLFRNQGGVNVHQEMLNLCDLFRHISKDPIADDV